MYYVYMCVYTGYPHRRHVRGTHGAGLIRRALVLGGVARRGHPVQRGASVDVHLPHGQKCETETAGPIRPTIQRS
jgi:hypothetical protein